MNIPFFNLIKNNDNQGKRIETQQIHLSKNNEKLIEMLTKMGVKQFVFTSFGNSIATGYSMNDTIKPLLLRNDDLITKLERTDIDLKLHSFALAQDNNDEHLLEWLIKNTEESKINKKAYLDFTETNGMDSRGITKEQAREYYNVNYQSDIGLHDLVMTGGDNLANIIVYNGATGSFLDNVTRKGQRKNLYGFYRDFVSMEAILKHIYFTNPNTQVYVCGIPNLMKINVVWFLNKKIKDICSLYPNCTYVNSVPQNFIYKKNGKIIVDIHYNDEEYLKLNNNIISSIVHNYPVNKALIEIDRQLKLYSTEAEYNHPELRDKNGMNSVINTILENYEDILTWHDYKKILYYYQEKYPYDYFYTAKGEIEENFKKIGG